MSEFLDIMKRSLKDFSIGDKGQFCGICESEEEIDDLLTKLQCSGYSYSVRNSFRRQSTDAKSSPGKTRFFFRKLQGPLVIPFFGSPFSVEYVCYRQCTLGPKYYDSKFGVPAHLADHIIPVRKRKYLIETKKVECPATFSVKCVRVYPVYTVRSAKDRGEQRKVIDTLRRHLESPNKPESFLRCYVVASPPDHHTHSTASTKASGHMHPRLASEISTHVRNGITSVTVIKTLLERFVEENFSGPDRPDRENVIFYPANKTIYTHIYNTLAKIKKAGSGQDMLQIQVDEVNEEPYIRATSSSISCLREKAKVLCKNIIYLTSSCDYGTLKNLIHDLENVHRSLELPAPVDSALRYAVVSNSKT